MWKTLWLHGGKLALNRVKCDSVGSWHWTGWSVEIQPTYRLRATLEVRTWLVMKYALIFLRYWFLTPYSLVEFYWRFGHIAAFPVYTLQINGVKFHQSSEQTSRLPETCEKLMYLMGISLFYSAWVTKCGGVTPGNVHTAFIQTHPFHVVHLNGLSVRLSQS